jgi:ribokinase
MTQKTSSLPEVISIGDLVADVIVAVPQLPAVAGQHQIAREVNLEPGGAANFLVMMARLGYPVAALGVFGDDIWGHQVAAMVANEGVDLSLVSHIGTTTTVIVVVGSTGDHVFFGKYGAGPEIELDSAAEERIAQAGAVYCAGYTLCEERLADMALSAMEVATANDVPVYFDPGPQMVDVPLKLRNAILSLTDVLLTTSDEIPLLAETGQLAELLRAGPHTVIVKQGGQGCAVYTGQQPAAVADIPGHNVSVVDTSAAGDSFNAAFIAAQMHGWSLTDSARLANVVGAVKVQKLGGGRNVPTLTEINKATLNLKVRLPEDLSLWLKG